MRYTIDFKYFSIDLVNEWIQLFHPKWWNWLEFHLLKVYLENERHLGTSEVEIYILCFGIRIYWVSNSNQWDSKIKEWNIKELGGRL